ncbi:MAG: (deoxy)nucleoside triphosphate pyrophosphohydrolase, partial [Candidatus Omnitrophica bacterium]|nr:(deoxy)nucleoside triphosphate pyrophosphohydrolase [Candidatus Omnitrophota bacterium]
VTVIECAIAVIVQPETGRILIAKRIEGDTYGGYWEFPGGKIKSAETPENCAVRETLEEVGLHIRVSKQLMTVEKELSENVLRLHFFECVALTEMPAALQCSEVKWADPETLTEYKFPPANEKIIDYIIKNSVCS